MGDASYTVGIVGAGVIAQQIGESLLERGFPLESMRFFGGEKSLGEEIEVANETYTVEPLDERSHELDFVFVTRETDWSERDVEAIILTGATVIDCSGQYARDVEVPLVVPEVNAEAAVEVGQRHIVASPDAVAIALAVVLAPLNAQAGVRRVVATALESVSEAGAAGIEELSRQTIELLQGRSTDAEVFPARICFNVLPNLGEVGPSGDLLGEEQSIWQLRRILDLSELSITLNRCCVPTFYGTGIALNVELQTPMDAAEAGDLLRAAPGILTTTPEEEVDLTIGDAVGQDATVVSRVRVDRSAENALNLWVSFDNSRKGAAVNAVQIAELILRQRD
jgi:aspartate-semialdehyde dehydrogenase